MSGAEDNEFLMMMQKAPAKQAVPPQQPKANSTILAENQPGKTEPKTRPSLSCLSSNTSLNIPQDLHALDPRPDLTKDHRLWVAVLMVANRIVGRELDALESMGEDRQVWEGAAGVLHGMRCYEARLQRRNNGTLKLDYRPVAEHTAKERDCSVAEAERYVLETYLEPHKVQIKAIFDRTIEVARLARKGRRVG